MTKHSYKELERQRRELEILHKASQMLMERGYTDLNMDDLANEVGISKPTLYQHFKSKEELVAQVIVQTFSTLDEHFSREMHGTAIQKIEQMFRLIVKGRFASHGVFAVLDSEAMWLAMRNHPTLVAHKNRGQEGVGRLVEEAKAAGEIVRHIPTPMIVQSLFCLQNVFRDPAIKAQLASDEAKLDQTISEVFYLFLHGVAPLEHSQTNETSRIDS